MTKLSPEALSLVDIARSELGPTPDDRRRLREQILARAAASATPTTNAADSAAPARGSPPAHHGSTSFARRHAFKIAGAGAIVLAAFVGFQQLSSVPARSARRAAETGGVPGATAVEPPRAPVVEPTASAARNVVPEPPRAISPDRLPDAPPTTPERRARTSVVATAAKATGSVAAEREGVPARTDEPPSIDLLGAEMRILREAHGALERGDLAHARARIDEHHRRYPLGVLREERLALEALVHCAAGRRADAQRAADELARANPRSSHLERLRGSCVSSHPEK